MWHSSGRYDVSWRFLGKFCFPNTIIPFPFPPFSFLSRMQRRGWRWSNHPRMLRRAGAPKSQAKDSQVQGHQGPGALMTRKQPDCGPLHGSFYDHNIPYLVKPLMESSWSLFHKKKTTKYNPTWNITRKINNSNTTNKKSSDEGEGVLEGCSCKGNYWGKKREKLILSVQIIRREIHIK